jgi:hypothetical protein
MSAHFRITPALVTCALVHSKPQQKSLGSISMAGFTFPYVSRCQLHTNDFSTANGNSNVLTRCPFQPAVSSESGEERMHRHVGSKPLRSVLMRYYLPLQACSSISVCQYSAKTTVHCPCTKTSKRRVPGEQVMIVRSASHLASPLKIVVRG